VSGRQIPIAIVRQDAISRASTGPGIDDRVMGGPSGSSREL